MIRVGRGAASRELGEAASRPAPGRHGASPRCAVPVSNAGGEGGSNHQRVGLINEIDQ